MDIRSSWLLWAALSLLARTPGELQPSPHFTAVQPELFAAGGSFTNAWGDYDSDGDADLFVGFNGAANRLYRNDGGTFAEVAAAAGVADARATRAVAWGDYDGDGDPDLLVGFTPGVGGVLRLYRNDGGRFADVSAALGLAVDSGAVRQSAFVDVDGDSDLDLYVAFRDRANMLFRNDGERLVDIAGALGLADPRKSVGGVWFDMDQDGDVDLFQANMDGDANALWRNEGGQFRDVATEAGVAWGGRIPGERTNGTVRACAADVNGDGRLDLVTANYGKNGLFLNRADGRFDDASAEWAVNVDGRFDSCALADYDGDGRIDLYVNGTVTGGTSYRDYLFRNTGTRFEDVTPQLLKELDSDHGVQWHDYDGDGDADLALTGVQPGARHALLRNDTVRGDSSFTLMVRLVDARGRATRAGATVVVSRNGRPLGAHLVDGGSGYDAQNAIPVAFTVIGAAPVELAVRWPSRGGVGRTMRRLAPREWSGRIVELRVP